MLIISLIIILCSLLTSTNTTEADDFVPIDNLETLYFGSGPSKPDNDKIVPFKVSLSDRDIGDLKERLCNTKFGFDPLEYSPNFEYGTNIDFLNEVKDFWGKDFSFRRFVRTMNWYPQFRTELSGMQVHFLRVQPPRGVYDRIYPLLIVHGWPGSIYEFHEIIPMLTDPMRFNLDFDFAFEVIAPSIPGYGYSDSPKKKGFSSHQAARIFGDLMARLGLNNYFCQGGDWGSAITTNIAMFYPERVKGLHINYPPSNYDGIFQRIATSRFLIEETGYFHMLSTKPDTACFSLDDSPLGLTSFILEKYSTGTNPEYRSLKNGGLTLHWSLQELLTNVMIYWTNHNIGPASRLYKEQYNQPHLFEFDASPINVPMGFAAFPHEIIQVPREFLEIKYKNLTQYTEMERGGHFAAFEEPRLLAEDIFVFAENL